MTVHRCPTWSAKRSVCDTTTGHRLVSIGARRAATAGLPVGYWLDSDLAMISVAAMLTLHGLNSFGVKKLSVRVG